jgi:hypothetical protein
MMGTKPKAYDGRDRMKREIIWVDTPIEALAERERVARDNVLNGVPWGEGPVVLVIGDPVRNWVLRWMWEWETVTIPIPGPVRRAALWLLGVR